MNKVEKCGEHLKDPLLLYNIIKEVQKEGVVGEEDTIAALTLKIMLRFVKDADATSSNIVVSDKSGGGKDFLVKAICKVILPKVDYYHRTGLTEKVFTYWNANKKDFTWTGKVIHLEDPDEDLIKSQGFKTMASGNSRNTVVKDQKAVDLKVKGKPVIIVTSFNTDIDIEGIRRWDTIRMDTTQRLTELVMKNRLLAKAGLIKNGVNHDLREGLHSLLTQRDVRIPFIVKILEVLPVNLAMRTISGKFADYIKASAILHQFQREKNEDGSINATWDDYDFARFVFAKTGGKHGVPLNTSEEEFLNILMENGYPMSVNEIAQKFSRSKSWIYKNINEKDKLKSTGLIYETQEFDEQANKDITKYYTTVTHDGNTLMPSWFWNSEESKNDENSKTDYSEKNGRKEGVLSNFGKMLLNINNNRLNNGLNKLLFDQNLSQSQIFDKTGSRKEEQQKETGFVKSSVNKVNEIPKPNLASKLRELSNFMKKNKESGRTINYEFLTNNFSKEFIDKCIKENIIYKIRDEYVTDY